MQRAIYAVIISILFAAQAYLRFQSDIIQDCAWFIYVAEGYSMVKRFMQISKK